MFLVIIQHNPPFGGGFMTAVTLPDRAQCEAAKTAVESLDDRVSVDIFPLSAEKGEG